MLNTIVIMGRLTHAPELKTTQSGVSVCSINLAVDRNFTRQGEEKQTDFFDVVCWRSTAEFVSRYMTKGQLVAVQGSMQSRKWQDRDGNNRVSWELQADNVYFAEPKREAQEQSAERVVWSRDDAIGVPVTENSSAEDFIQMPPDDDLPF